MHISSPLSPSSSTAMPLPHDRPPCTTCEQVSYVSEPIMPAPGSQVSYHGQQQRLRGSSCSTEANCFSVIGLPPSGLLCQCS